MAQKALVRRADMVLPHSRSCTGHKLETVDWVKGTDHCGREMVS